MDEMPILPAHIEHTVRAIAKLHADHHGESGRVHRGVERITASIGSPRFIVVLTAVIVVWVAANLAVGARGAAPWDPPPFAWLQDMLALAALYVTLVILTTQRRDDKLASYREQLTLELAILGEQKTAKIIALLEEMRRDDPLLANRVDPQAAAMSVAADPQTVLNAIKETELFTAAEELSEEAGIMPG